MKLELRYTAHALLPIKAAFFRGTEIHSLLYEIGNTNPVLEDLEIYVVPESLQSIQAVGLFVVFKEALTISIHNLADPYCLMGDKLYIPFRTEIFPQVGISELNNLLLYDLHMLHPVIGMIGFEKTDRLDVSGLFAFRPPVEKDWSLASPGIAPKPPFSEIKFAKPSTQEMMEEIKKQIGEKKLGDMIEELDGKSSGIQRLLENIKYHLLKSVFSITQLFSKPFIENNKQPGGAPVGKPGLFMQFQKWLSESIEDLEQKRKDEIERLLSLFDQDKDEALQYAIPLDSPYLNRGTRNPSSKLKRNPLNFNLGKLGGGIAVDTWDIGDNYQSLRSKYLNAANSKLQEGDFKKAAYIYAHLLGDYHAAANALEQGKMHREAAVLYKDHLKNTPAAAECLERGELYAESIDLYKELEKYEKIGDLYKKLNQPDNAEFYYEKLIDINITNNDYLDAGRVMNEKLYQKEKAMDIYLRGWNSSNQREPCLKKYFDLIIDSKPDETNKKLREVYGQQIPRHKRTIFLNVLEYVGTKANKETLAERTDMAFEIIHDEVESGNTQILYSLKRFMPNDKLIGSDSSRYTNLLRSRNAQEEIPSSYQLDLSIKWIKVTWHRNQYLAIGLKNSYLHLARGNWYGNIEYYTWANRVVTDAKFQLIDAPYSSNHILLHSSEGLPISRKNLPKNKYFAESLIVNCPIWLHKGNAHVCMNDDQTLVRLEISHGNMRLNTYSIDGDLKASKNCISTVPFDFAQPFTQPPTILKDEGFYYSFHNTLLYGVDENGNISTFDCGSSILMIAGAFAFKEPWLVVSTSSGCILFHAKQGDFLRKGDFFSYNPPAESVRFISGHRLVITEGKKAYLFEIDTEIPRELKQIETDAPIIGVLPTSSRHQFAVVEENGRIKLLEL